MKRIFVISILAFVVVACSKDKFETKPHVSVKSFNPSKNVAQGSALEVRLEFTDQEGDLDSVYVFRKRVNAKGPVTLPGLPFGIPEFNGEKKGEIFINMDYATILTLALNPIHIPGSNPSANYDDSLQLRFVLVDKAKHVSDTTEPKIVFVNR